VNTTHADGTDEVFRNVGTKNSDAGGNTQKKEYDKETAISKHYSRQHNVISTEITG